MSLKAEVTGSRFPKSGGWEPIVTIKAKASDDCDWDSVAKITHSLTAPASDQQIIEWLTVLAVETANRSEDDGTQTLRFKVLADRLKAYSGDVVRETLRDWPETNTFFPSAWNELKKALNAKMGNRIMIADKLRQAMAIRGVPEEPKPKDRWARIREQQAKVMGEGS